MNERASYDINCDPDDLRQEVDNLVRANYENSDIRIKLNEAKEINQNQKQVLMDLFFKVNLIQQKQVFQLKLHIVEKELEHQKSEMNNA